jgi:hypothetical protein
MRLPMREHIYGHRQAVDDSRLRFVRAAVARTTTVV